MKNKRLLLHKGRCLPLLFATVFALTFGSHHSLSAQEPDADTILQKMEETLFPDSYHMEMEMTTRDSGRDKAMEFETWYRKGTGTYMEILSPARSRGTRFLQKEGALWMFMPRSGSRSPVRLPARDSFQGSAFSNEDMGDSSYTDDYTPSLIRTEEFDHPELGPTQCWLIKLEPSHREAAYGSIQAWITREGFIPLRMDYFVRSGLRSKQMFLYDIKDAAGRRRPLRMEMESLDERGKVSVVQIKKLEEQSSIPDRTFSRSYLTR
jgi:outer membrane lipoprotein-sorting protein